MATIEDAEYRESKVDFWNDVYGVDMSSIKQWVLREPLVDSVEKHTLNSPACCILDINLTKVTISELDFSAKYKFKIFKDDIVHAIIAW